MEEFNRLCPEPEPPGKLTKDGWVPDEEDAGYKSDSADHQKRRIAYIAVNSLIPSQIEWDTVNSTIPRRGPIGKRS